MPDSKQHEGRRGKTLNVRLLPSLFSLLKSKDSFLASLDLMCEKLTTEEDRSALVEKIRLSNMSYYILQVSSYSDSHLGKEPFFVNTQDSNLNDIFELPRNFVFPCLEGEKLFLFDYNGIRNLIDTRKNAYNRQELTPDFLEHIKENYQNYDRVGLAMKVVPMSEFLDEMVNGRKIEEACSCSTKRSHAHKLVRLLRHYRVTMESLERVNLNDILVKLGMISYKFQASELSTLWINLYQAIKTAPPDQQESLKRTVSSIILIYSQPNSSYVI